MCQCLCALTACCHLTAPPAYALFITNSPISPSSSHFAPLDWQVRMALVGVGAKTPKVWGTGTNFKGMLHARAMRPILWAYFSLEDLIAPSPLPLVNLSLKQILLSSKKKSKRAARHQNINVQISIKHAALNMCSIVRKKKLLKSQSDNESADTWTPERILFWPFGMVSASIYQKFSSNLSLKTV